MSQKQNDPQKGYGNIYTPHAGSMIITVQREAGLANRTLVLSPRRVKALRLLNSKIGIGVVSALVLSWVVLAILAVRVPMLHDRIASMERDAARLDTLEHTLGELQERYTQVQRMLGAAPAATPAAATPATTPPRPAARTAPETATTATAAPPGADTSR